MSENRDENIGELTAVGTTLFFTHTSPAGKELWKSDGTPAGTVPVTPIVFAGHAYDELELTAMGGRLFFAANDDVYGSELWQSDGTAVGTVLVKDSVPGSLGSHPSALAVINNMLVFAAWDVGRGYELFRSDGTEAGTGPVQDLEPGTSNSDPRGFVGAGGQVFFHAYTPQTNDELWVMPVAALSTVLMPATATPTVISTATATAPPSSSATAIAPPSTSVTATVPPSSSATVTVPPSSSATATVPPSSGPTATAPPSSATTTPSDAWMPNVSAGGGTVTSADGSITLTFPAGAVRNDLMVRIADLAAFPALPVGQRTLHSFTLQATDRVGSVVRQFAQPYTLTLSYTAGQLAAQQLDSATLQLVYWNGTAWAAILPCAGCSLNQTNHQLTVHLDHMTDFAFIGRASRTLYLPLLTR